MFMPQGPIVVTPVVDASGPMKVTATLEQRLSQSGVFWFLERVASPFLGELIQKRFAAHGDSSVGTWPPLAAYTERLKSKLGAPAGSPNIRTGAMMDHLVHDHSIEPMVDGALVRIPGNSSVDMQKKIRTAQVGDDGGSNAFGSATPARPVLAIGTLEEAGINRLFDSYLWTGIA